MLPVWWLYGGCSEAKGGLWGSCGVIKKVKDCLLAFYLLFLVRDRFRSFLFQFFYISQFFEVEIAYSLKIFIGELVISESHSLVSCC